MIGRTALLMLLIMAAPRAARGDDRAEAMEHAIKGNRAFDLGDYDEAIKEYATAYRIKDDPALLYNLAQANRQAGHTADAKRFYRVYLARVPAAANRHEVELRIAELDRAEGAPVPVTPAGSGAATVASSRTSTAPHAAPSPAVEPAAPPAAAPASVPETPAATADAPVAATTAPARQPRAAAGPGVTLRRAGIGAAAAGLAVVIGGIVCGALAHGDANTLTSLAHHDGTFEPGTESAGKALQATEGALIAVGAAAVVAGVVLYVVGRRQARRVHEAPAAAAAAATTPLLVRF